MSPSQRPTRQPARPRRPRNAIPYEVTDNTTPVAQTARATRQNQTPVPDEENEHDDTTGIDGQDVDEDQDTPLVYLIDGIDEGDGTADGEEVIEEVPMDVDPPFDGTGLKEIGNLASWTVSSYKPGCGIGALRDPDPSQFWQSDGPQPHHLNIHFSRLVAIRSIRILLDFELDESYTPTRITLLAGTAYHDLIPFSALEFTQPKGWIDVPLDGVGGGRDGKELRAFLVQVRVVENHQNGKDTHVRGLRIYARDEKIAGPSGLGRFDEIGDRNGDGDGDGEYETFHPGGLPEPDWMGEPELR